jgi:hypothetical protein
MAYNLQPRTCLEIWSANLEPVFETLSLQNKEIEHLMFQNQAYMYHVPVVAFGNCFLFMI